MNTEQKEIERYLRLGEDAHREFKRIVFSDNRPKEPRPDDLADEIAAFANADGGVLLCGVSDNGEVQDMTREQLDNLVSSLTEICCDRIKPPVYPTIERRETEDGKLLVMVTIKAGDAMHQSPGGAYLRVGDSKRQMRDEKFRLAHQRAQSRFVSFDEQPVRGTGFGSLDKELWKLLISAQGASDPQLSLLKMGLLTKDEKGVLRASIAGVLLCSATPEQWLPHAYIVATHYRGVDRSATQIDSQEITGSLQHQIAQAVLFVMRNMRVSARKMPARVETPEYSIRAVFEAVVNAVAHRDYSIRGSRIRIAMFANRLEISSPGGLPNNLTEQSMMDRQATRNQVLVSVLRRVPVPELRETQDRQYIMEQRGDGVPIIRRDTYELCGRYPEYREIDKSELVLSIPSAPQESSEFQTSVVVRYVGKPLAGVDILIIYPNKTWKRATTDATGEAFFDLHTAVLPMTVFLAADGYAAKVVHDLVPREEPLDVKMENLSGGGSAIFTKSTGYLPTLSGQLSIILDIHGRTYLYADNVSINQGAIQPVHFLLGETLQLTDSDGHESQVRVVDIVGQSSLLEYQ